MSQTSHTGRLLPFCREEILGVQFGPEEELYVSYTERTVVAWLWCVYFVFTIPELLSWLRSVRVCLMRSVSRAHWMDVALVAALESLHVVGVALLFFGALPAMDSAFAVMVTSGAALFPATLRVASGKTFVRPRKKWMKVMFTAFSVSAVIIQVVGLIVFPIVYDSLGFDKGWQLAVGLLLTSFGKLLKN